MNNAPAAGGTGVGCRPPFTASQWEELEHQALIFKYLIAGMPVPPELLLPIRRSYETMTSRFYSHPALGYCTYYGKKLDPEPGRCRRTDGKKWRCSKDAYTDSKYCERHMHRGRNRSRKHVESPQALSQSQSSSSSSATTSLSPSAWSSGSGAGSSATPSSAGASGGSFHAFSLQSIASTHQPAVGLGNAGTSYFNMDPSSYGAKDFRSTLLPLIKSVGVNLLGFIRLLVVHHEYIHGSKPGLDGRSIYCEASGNLRGLGIDSSLDSLGHLMPSPFSTYPASKVKDGSFIHNSFPQLQPLDDLGQVTISSLPKQQHSIFRNEFGSSEPSVKAEHLLRPFFEEWPSTRDLWSDVEDERSNSTTFSTTQLSMSIPMPTSDFSTSSCRTPSDD
ncbi:Growth-regulating factor 5 [Apostasia shenzhenica]|uniref:Growth-regulating factor n=1 Tax=Apostasia shenzhenica TaxID=1088818 RepID=A0A2I0B8J9_9ASPA|nr:Growth-regulating factor 5 [Apostasia shenzhenica]